MERKAIYLLIVLLFVSVQQDFGQQNSYHQITHSDTTRNGFPDWSPDGAYIYYGESNRETCNTMRIPSGGGPAVRITDYFTQHTRCSPDGRFLVFDAEFGTLIQICSSEGGSPIRIISENISINRSGMPCWSPDGRHIAFHSNGQLCILNLAKGTVQKICAMERKVVAPFDWSPDGNYIIADVRDTIQRGEADIWKIPVDDSVEPKQLTFMPAYQVEPDISPDGKWIVFTSWTDRESTMDLYIISADGGEPVQITSGEGHDSEACWSPDGKKIAFSSTRSGSWNIWTMEPEIQIKY